jgi:hypothetical protein
MNTNLKRTLMALAVTTLFGASVAYAQDDGNSNNNSVTIKKHVSLSTNININGDPSISGAIAINSAAIALENGTQSTMSNVVINGDGTNNNSSISGNVGMNSSGNVGANVAAGDDNSQANAAALATSVSGSSSSSSGETPACPTCGKGGGSSSDPSAGEMADAEAFADQSVAFNKTANFGTYNSASVSGNAFDGASGNIGVNVASGDDNEQLNGLAASTTDDNVYATATASTDQQSHNNGTLNAPYCDTATSNNASLSGNAFEGASGNIGVNVASGSGNLQANTLAVAAASK